MRPARRLGVLLALAVFAASAAGGGASPRREMAITFDDLPGVVAPEEGTAPLAALTERLLAAVAAARIPAAGFVNEGKLGPTSAPDPERVALLEKWAAAGLELGNHTFSHRDLHRSSLEEFESDVAAGEKTTTAILEARGRSLRYFRHPFLHTGSTLEIRRALESFLAERGYRVAPVTIDNSEWIFARAYALARAKNDRPLGEKVAAAYVPYMVEKTAYFERQSVKLFGREIRQILLLHANRLNADRFPDLSRRLRERGYAFVTLDRALEDPAYQSKDTFTGRGGISWLHRWALSGMGPVLADEPAAPRFVLDAAGVAEE